MRRACIGGSSYRRSQGKETGRHIFGCFFRYQERRTWSRFRSSGPSNTVSELQVLLLAPNTLSTTAENGYKNRKLSWFNRSQHRTRQLRWLNHDMVASLIAMLVLGGCFFIAWCVWDGFFAEYPFMPRRIFNRTLVSAPR
jgi:hypothetical protein